MFDSRNSYYKTPYGAVGAGTEIRLRLRLPQGTPGVPLLQLYRPRDEQPLYTVEFRHERCEDGRDVWGANFTPPEPALLFYWFDVGGRKLTRHENGRADWDAGHMWQLTVYDPAYTTPAALAGAVTYQIFPDRFRNSGAPRERIPSDRVIHADWYEEMNSRPDPDGVFRCDDYYGGDLRGITEKLDYIASLGVELIYLNPVFEAHANHRYNTADYMAIDPLLGCRENFTELCARAKERGISVMLDGVFNHTGSDSVYFNKYKRYGSGGAYNDPQSPYRGWFKWIDWPTQYMSWWGFDTLPDVNEDFPGYIDFICGEQGVLRSWLRAGACGWRLDVADELPDRFIEKIRAAVKAEGEDKLLIGEVWEDASNKYSGGEQRRYLLGAELDSAMNYPWREAILSFCRYGGGQALNESVLSVLENYPPQSAAALLTNLSTHDVPRAITVLGGEELSGRDRDWQREHNKLSPEQYMRGRQLFLLASAVQFTLPGCPSLYYGDEAGLTGYADPFNRGTYPWGREDAGLLDCLRLLGLLHRDDRALRRGEYRPLAAEQDMIAYLRIAEGERVLVCVNRGESACRIPFDSAELDRAQRLLVIGGMPGSDTLEGLSAAVLRLPD